MFPNEIVEEILIWLFHSHYGGFVVFHILMAKLSNYRLVCRQFNDILLSDYFSQYVGRRYNIDENIWDQNLYKKYYLHFMLKLTDSGDKWVKFYHPSLINKCGFRIYGYMRSIDILYRFSAQLFMPPHGISIRHREAILEFEHNFIDERAYKNIYLNNNNYIIAVRKIQN